LDLHGSWSLVAQGIDALSFQEISRRCNIRWLRRYLAGINASSFQEYRLFNILGNNMLYYFREYIPEE
jgi:hypothetical protein